MGSIRSNWAGKFGTGVRCITRAAGRAGVNKVDLWSQASTGRKCLTSLSSLPAVGCVFSTEKKKGIFVGIGS